MTSPLEPQMGLKPEAKRPRSSPRRSQRSNSPKSSRVRPSLEKPDSTVNNATRCFIRLNRLAAISAENTLKAVSSTRSKCKGERRGRSIGNYYSLPRLSTKSSLVLRSSWTESKLGDSKRSWGRNSSKENWKFPDSRNQERNDCKYFYFLKAR